jgi:hypothetical protein
LPLLEGNLVPFWGEPCPLLGEPCPPFRRFLDPLTHHTVVNYVHQREWKKPGPHRRSSAIAGGFDCCYEVEYIIRRRWARSPDSLRSRRMVPQWYYLVAWVGYPDQNTWEPISSFLGGGEHFVMEFLFRRGFHTLARPGRTLHFDSGYPCVPHLWCRDHLCISISISTFMNEHPIYV